MVDIPEWVQELTVFKDAYQVFALTGNVRDQWQQADMQWADLTTWVATVGAAREISAALLGLSPGNTDNNPLQRLCSNTESDPTEWLVVMEDVVHLLFGSSAAPTPSIRVAEATAWLLAYATPIGAGARTPRLVLVAPDRRSLPTALLTHPFVRLIDLPMPSFKIRRARALDGLKDGLAAQSSGLMARQVTILNRLIPVARRNPVFARRLLDIGLRRDPWSADEIGIKVAVVGEALRKRIFGQEAAVKQIESIVARAATGFTGAHTSSPDTRPRAAMFFAGPTGVGKTETAKLLAEHIMGRTEDLVRFDMSEFRAEHSDQRLLGAPPGYVGHDAGGELINAVRANPFAILLFDEIEKAHRTILDKFLQILDAGRLTSGQGETVSFAQTMLVFTSNLGVGTGDYQKAIRDHFVKKQRPEFYGRVGEHNVVVFERITREEIRKVVRLSCDNITRALRSSGMAFTYDEDVIEVLVDTISDKDLELGARNVGNRVEEHLSTPLAAAVAGHNTSRFAAKVVNQAIVICEQ